MKLAIVGSKTFEPDRLVQILVDQVPDETVLVLTGMPGPSQAAEQHSRGREMPRPQVFSIPRGKHPKEKFFEYSTIRNKKLVAESDVIVVFTDGKCANSREIADMAIEDKKPVYLIGSDAPERYVIDLFDFIERARGIYDKQLAEWAAVNG